MAFRSMLSDCNRTFNLQFDAAVAAGYLPSHETGLAGSLTELDVAVPLSSNGDPVDPSNFARQAEIYR